MTRVPHQSKKGDCSRLAQLNEVELRAQMQRCSAVGQGDLRHPAGGEDGRKTQRITVGCR